MVRQPGLEASALRTGQLGQLGAGRLDLLDQALDPARIPGLPRQCARELEAHPAQLPWIGVGPLADGDRPLEQVDDRARVRRRTRGGCLLQLQAGEAEQGDRQGRMTSRAPCQSPVRCWIVDSEISAAASNGR
jgi:hypothetical protein